MALGTLDIDMSNGMSVGQINVMNFNKTKICCLFYPPGIIRGGKREEKNVRKLCHTSPCQGCKDNFPN